MGEGDRVGAFWDAQSASYNSPEHVRARSAHPRHSFAHERLKDELKGCVLSVGGLWVGAVPRAMSESEITVLDVSAEMLSSFETQGARGVLGDGRDMPFSAAQFDHVVFPLVIHHITDGGARGARRNTIRVLKEAHRVLRPHGSVWVREITVPRWAYAIQLASAPLSERVLARFGIPLVILHSNAFLRDALLQTGFGEISEDACSDPRRLNHFVRPVVGLPQLVVPEAFLPPLRHVLLRGRT